jgi:hypothetical protein
MRKLLAALSFAALLAPLSLHAWWEKGHRLTAEVAWDHLTPVARDNVKALLGVESMADVAAWADVYRPTVTQTGYWHYTDIPAGITTYDRDRDCPVQPGVKLGSRSDKQRDCVTDRILFFEDRVRDAKADSSERAIALKFLIHFIGDVHQPFHASGVAAGGNDIAVTAFGADTCPAVARPGHPQATSTYKCNLHAVWDGYLISRRQLSDAEYLKRLEDDIQKNPPALGDSNPVLWTEQSKALSDAALVEAGTNIDEAYYAKSIPIIDRQLELGGLRLAAVLNGIFTAPPVPFKPAPLDPDKE